MTVAGLIGDDEHTAKDDAYVRAMKSRKWLFLAAIACIGVWAGHFAPSPFPIGMGDVTVDASMWKRITASGLLYAAAQFLFLGIQLVGRYKSLLAERFGERQFHQFQENRTALLKAEIELAALNGDQRAQRMMAMQNAHDHFLSPESFSRESIDSLKEGLQGQIAQLRAATADTPSLERPTLGYRACEIAIDCIRLGVPAILGIIAAGTIFTNL